MGMLVWMPNNIIAMLRTSKNLLVILFAISVLVLWVGIWLRVSQPFWGNQDYSYYSLSLPLFSIANKHFNSFKNTSFYKGVKKGYSIELLPNSIKNYYYNTFNKIFRITGGLFTILVISNLHLYLNFFFIDYIIMFISLLFLLQVFIINVIRIIYGIYLFIYKKEVFEVKNSPVNVLATKWSMVTVCLKYGICAPLATLGTITTLGVVGDSVHQAAGGRPVFVPWVAKHWREVYKDLYGEYPSTQVIIKADEALSNPKPDSDESLIPSIFTQEEVKEFDTLNTEQKIQFRKDIKQTFKNLKEQEHLPKDE